MAWTVKLYNHNSATEGCNEVSLNYYGYGTTYIDFTTSFGTSGKSLTGYSAGTLYFQVSEIADGYDFVCWHYTIEDTTAGESASGTNSSSTFEMTINSSTSSGTLHLWPEMEYIGSGSGDDEEEPVEEEWFVTEGPLVDDLTDTYTKSYTLDPYEVYRIDFSCAEAGDVNIYSTLSNVDTYGYICQYGEDVDPSDGTPYDYIERNDDGGSGSNFDLTFWAEAGTRYTLYVKGYDGNEEGRTRIYIVPPVAPSTLIVSNMVIGSNPTFSFTKFNSDVEDTLTYKFYNLTGTIVSDSTATTYSGWTVPTTFYEQIPNATSGVCTLTLESYYDGNLVGTTTYDVTVQIGSSCTPVLTPVIQDIKPETVALTGDANIIVKGISMVEYVINAVAQNSATIVSQYIENGSQRIEDLAQGIIDEPESGLFTVSATDSRGLVGTIPVEKTFVEYVKPTCYQKIKMEMSGQTQLIINGSYFNGSFGATANELKLEVRHTQNDGTMGDWVELTDGLVPILDGNSYTLDVTISGFDYRQAYTFQCRVTDKLYSVESQSYTARWLPVFDWSDDDFNFNVPVNIGADTLDFYNNTVIRYNNNVNNTVLSAGGGHIYLRPGGTNSTSGEVRITAQGDIELAGDIIINGVSLTEILSNAGLM